MTQESWFRIPNLFTHLVDLKSTVEMGLDKSNVLPKVPEEQECRGGLSQGTETLREMTVGPFFTGLLQGIFSVIAQRRRERRAEAERNAEIREVTDQSPTSERN